MTVKACANDEALLRKEDCVQDPKMFLENFKNIFCFQDEDFVCLTYTMWVCKRGSI